MAKPTIKGLTEEITELKEEAARNAEMLKELRTYLNSPKFRCGDELDGYVSISDVLTSLNN